MSPRLVRALSILIDMPNAEDTADTHGPIITPDFKIYITMENHHF